MARKTGLTAALEHAAAGKGELPASPAEEPVSVRLGSDPTWSKKPDDTAQKAAKSYREGKVNVTGYFAPAVKQSLRLIQAKHPGFTVQDLLAEALDGLFAKYNVPQSARVKD